MKKFFLSILLMLASSSLVFSQNIISEKTTKKISYNEAGAIKQVSFKKGTVNQEATPSLLKELSKETANIEFVLKSSTTDKHNMTHEEYSRSYKGVPIDLEVYKIHFKNNYIVSANGEYSPIQLNEQATKISADEAFQKALDHIQATTYAWESNEQLNPKTAPQLVILPATLTQDQQAKYAYKIDVFAVKPLSRHWVYIDAITGQVLFKDPIIKHAERHNSKDPSTDILPEKKSSVLVEGNGDTRYSGNQILETTQGQDGLYILKDQIRNIHVLNANQTDFNNITEFTDDDNVWSEAEYNNAYKDNAALDVLWGMGKTYDYFKEKFDRDSYDDLGAPLIGYVHVDYQYNNAFWSGSYMGYGDGSSNGEEGNGIFDALTSLDVTAHEIGHGICQETADLIYERESGALNEGFSDIWRAAVEFYGAPNDPNKDTWLIGEEIDRRTGSVGLRSMKNPKIKFMPNTYEGQYWRPTTVEGCPYPDMYENDYCGVHTNSSVLNHWFYLLSEGGSGTNDNNYAYEVEGIGIENAAEIVYCSLTSYLTYNSKFEDAKDFTMQCASNIFGEESEALQSTKDAWAAVGLKEDEELFTHDFKTEKIIIYPNPVKDFIHVAIQQNGEQLAYKIISLNGQNLAEGQLINGRIDTKNLLPGSYVLLINGQNIQHTQKFIKK